VARNKKNEREEPVSIDYIVHKVDGKWRIYDIVTEGSSLVSNYKSQFRRVIKKNGFETLMDRMKKKLDKEQA
jgi:phospholipid transport system substrate-binding protein